MNMSTQKKILVVDDETSVRESVSLLLRKKLGEENGYAVVSCGNALDAIDIMQDDDIDIVLSDIRMPGFSGMQMLESIRKINRQIPVLLMTAYADLDTAVEAIKQGATDFFIKPLDPDVLIQSIKKALKYDNLMKFRDSYRKYLEHEVAEKANALESTKKDADNFGSELIKRLTAIATFRDTEGGEHMSRIGIYSVIIAGELGMPVDFIRLLKYASPLHDIGKVGITDQILFKPGPLTQEEFEIMKLHTVEGAKILSGSTSPVIRTAESIALTHHERWDGTGYPKKLKSGEIPLEGRIVMLADQYDAIRSKRVYKPEVPHEDTVRIITQGDGRTMPGHFDPEVLDAFISKASMFDEIYHSYQDSPECIKW